MLLKFTTVDERKLVPVIVSVCAADLATMLGKGLSDGAGGAGGVGWVGLVGLVVVLLLLPPPPQPVNTATMKPREERTTNLRKERATTNPPKLTQYAEGAYSNRDRCLPAEPFFVLGG